MFIWSPSSSGVEFWSVDHASIYEHSEFNGFRKTKCFGEISNNWPNDLLGTNVYNNYDFFWQSFWQHYNELILLQ